MILQDTEVARMYFFILLAPVPQPYIEITNYVNPYKVMPKGENWMDINRCSKVNLSNRSKYVHFLKVTFWTSEQLKWYLEETNTQYK